MIEIQELSVNYGTKCVIDQVSLTIEKAQTVALIGESGSGKSSLGKAILQLIRPISGRVHFCGCELTALKKQALFPFRREMQMVFQHPGSSLNPCMTVEQLLREGMRIHKLPNQTQRVKELLSMVGLNPDRDLCRYPNQFSGGQKQRIAIAQALSTKPKFLVLDEPTASLDTSIQAQIVNLLADLQQSMELTYLFICHDLLMVRHLADKTAVLKDGQLVEVGPTETLFKTPRSSYTMQLLSAAPPLHPKQPRAALCSRPHL